MSSTFKVGVMTLIACLLMIYMMFVIGDISLQERGYRFVVRFYSVNGLSEGSSVSMAGVKIGKVERIEIQDDQVHVHAYVRDKKHRIRRHSSFTIGTAGLMGEKFVEIVPTRDISSPYLFDGAIVGGIDPTRMEELFDQGNILLQRLQELTASAKEIIADPELKASTKAMFKNAENASERINDLIASVQTRADNIIANLDEVMKTVNEELQENRQDIRALIDNLRDFSKNLSNISAENRADLKQTIANIKSLSERIDTMVANLDKNKELTDNLRGSIQSLRKASDDAKEITREVKEIVTDKDIRSKIKTGLDDAHKLAQAVDKVFLNIKQTRIDLKYLLRYNRDKEEFFSDMMADIYPTENSFYRLGVEDIGGDPLFNLMLAKDANQRIIKRAGVISSKVGIGFDYRWAEGMTYSLDFIDTRKPTSRFTSSYLLRPGLKLQLRVDDISDKKDVNFAVEYRF